MRVNFIRQISDDILKENQDLKAALIANKHQLNIYERQIVDFIERCNLQSPTLATPQQTLELFINVVREEIDSRKEQETKVQKVTQKCDALNRQNNTLQQELHKRKNEEEFRQKKWREGLLAAEELEYEMKQEISELKLKDQCYKNRIKEIEDRQKIEMMLLEEGKRKEIEESRQYYHKTMMEERDRLELQYVKEVKNLKQELSDREKRMKDLEKMSQKLAANAKLDPTDITIFAQLVKSLQQSQRTTKNVELLKHELFQLKQHFKDLERMNLNLVSQVTEHKVKEENYLSTIQRQQLEREQFESRLKIKMEEIEKHEKDKDSMESYYAHKWNQQFQNVKKNLQKTFHSKLDVLQKEYEKKTDELLLKTSETESKIRKYQARNKQLQSIFKSNQTTIQNMQQMLEDRTQSLQKAQRESQEAWIMSREQIISTKIQNEEKTEGYRDKIQEMQEELIKREKKYQTVNSRFNDMLTEKLKETVTRMTQEMAEQSERFESEKTSMMHEHDYQVSKLNVQVEKWKQKASSIKAHVSAEYEQRLHSVVQAKEQKLKEKDEDCLRKLERAAYKYKQLQLKFGSIKKEIDEERHSFSRDMLMYEKEIESFKNIRLSMEEEIAKHAVVKEDLKRETEAAREEVAKLQLALDSRQKDIQDMRTTREQAVQRAEEFQQKQQWWQGQLKNVEVELRHQFEKVRHNAQNQVSILKSKIWYLEEKTKQPMISEKNYLKLLKLEEQKDELKTLVEIKEAENIVLSQVKDYYQHRFRQSEYGQNDQERKVSRVILARKTTKLRKPSCANTYSNSMFEEPKEIVQMRKYITLHNRKQQQGMCKTGFNNMSRIKTNPL